MARGIEGAVGATPMMRLRRLPAPGSAQVLVKLEYLNPSGSIKDRVALAAIEDAEARGDLRPGGTIVEASGGNMGLALALLGAARGYRVIIVMPEEVPHDHVRRLELLGAEIVHTRPIGGMVEAERAARRLTEEHPGYWLVDQFNNPSTVRAHRDHTGPELLQEAGCAVDVFVAGVGTGGTLTGVGQALKAANPATTIVAVEPARSSVLSGESPGHHRIAGIGADFVPPLLERALVGRTVCMTDEAAFKTARDLAAREGLFAGPSSGANVAVALEIAANLGEGCAVATILPDGGEHYLHELS
ncbi:MAG: cysteine synthase family protein [Dehalococcoidia bacterium]